MVEFGLLNAPAGTLTEPFDSPAQVIVFSTREVFTFGGGASISTYEVGSADQGEYWMELLYTAFARHRKRTFFDPAATSGIFSVGVKPKP
jgi:hypothetical protein